MVSKSKVVVAVVLVLFLVSLVGVLQLSAIEDEPEGYDLDMYVEYDEGEEREVYDPEERREYAEALETYEEGGYCAAPDMGREEELEKELARVQESLRRVREEKEELVAHVEAEHSSHVACDGASGERVWESVVGHQRVLFPSFPASGGPELMDAISYMLDMPVCSVYPEGDGKAWNAEFGIADNDDVVECRCAHGADCEMFGGAAAAISSYFPAITQQVKIPEVDKIIVMARNPVDNIEAFWRMCKETNWLASRRRAWKWHFEQEIAEYKKFHDFWDRYAVTVGAMFKAVRYEDLCSNPLPTLAAIFSFLDVPASRINWARADGLRLDDFCYSFDQEENGVHRYTEGQGGKISSVLGPIVDKYGYGDLVREYAPYWVGVPDE